MNLEPVGRPTSAGSARRRALASAAVAVGWLAGGLPAAFGWQRCAAAVLLHRPCPGCGTTRALRLLAGGHVAASLRIQPLAVPSVAAGGLLVAATVWATWRRGAPIELHRDTLGRVAIGLEIVVALSLTALWVARAFGTFGGPVPV
ncbi:MAG: DUF2752 domain-containing protein [Polyangiaceae bacterium]|jgi:hypothetical protein